MSHSSSLSIGGVRPRLARLALFTLVAFAAALPAAAVTHHVDVLLDLDNDVATGCTVATSEGPFDGVEQILRSVVETEALPAPSATVVEVVRLECVSGSTFDLPVPVDDGDWPVGIGLGDSGSDVIETYFPAGALPPDVDTVRLGVTIRTLGSGNEDALLVTEQGQPILVSLANILEIPTLSEWGLLLLAGLLAAAAAWRLRRRAVVATLVALLVLGGAGVAWATTILDGQPTDWQLGTKRAGTPPAACTGLRIASLYAKAENGQLCLRIDACLEFNTAPVAQDDAFTTPEDTPVAGNVLADNGSGADADADGDPLTVDTTPVTAPANGGLVLLANGDFTYTPDANFNGSDSFEYQITDGNGGSDVGLVTITVTAVNDAPVADAQSVTTDEDTPVVITLTGSDTDGDALTFAIGTAPTNGSLGAITPIDATSAQVTYTPNGDFNGADSFTFTANDGTATSPAATVSITVDAVNDAPVADAQSVTTDEDVPVVITLTGSDTDGDALTFAIGTGPTNGSLGAITPIDATSAQVTYTPNGNFNGADSFTFTVDDGTATSPAATVSITVDAVNDTPVADAQSVTTDEDVPVVITLTGSDTDGDALTFAIDSGASNGGLSAITPIDATSAQVTYTPGADFNGADSFTFTASDGTATSAAATVSITVNPVNDPALVDLDADDSEGTGGNDFAFAYTENDGPQPLLDATDAAITDIDGTTLSSVTLTLTNLLDAGQEVLAADATGFPNITVDAFDTTTVPGSGILVISAGTPQPIADFEAVLRTATYEHTGDDPDATDRVIQVTANDGGGDGPVATSTASITAVNDTPVADAQSVTTDEDTPVVITLTGSDADGDPLTFAIGTGPANGSLSAITPIDATSAQVTYTPNGDFNGADSFTFTVDDGTATSPAATVSITVDAVNDAPAADAQSVTTDEDVPVVITLTGTDVDGDSLTFAIGTGPTSGSLSAITPIDATSAQVTYTPNGDFNGADSFTFTANDGTVTSPAATVSITVNAVNDTPVADAQSVSTDEDTPLVITLTGSDVDGDSLTFAIGTGPANGSLGAITPIDATSAQVTYTPNGDFNGADSFTFTANDGTATSPAATVSITVNAVNDAPVANAQSVSTDEDTPLVITLTGSDVDGDSLTFAIGTGPASGSLSAITPIDATSAQVTYTPNLDFNGADSFTFTVNDGTATSAAATVSITVNAVNDPPTANDDAANITEEAPNVAALNTVSGNVLTNDTDVDSALTVSAVAGGSVGSPKAGTYGSVTINSDGSFTYTLDDANPTVNALAPGQMLTDPFGYTASDGALSDSATLTVTIHGADDPATPDDDAFDFLGNTELRVDQAAATTPHALETTAPDGIDGVLEGDVDPDGGPAITVSGIVGCADPTAPFDCVIAGEGTVSLDADGSFSFLPEPGDADATATFQYTLTGNAVNVGTVTLTRFERIWYVDPSAPAGGDGTSDEPFDTLSSLDGAGGAGDSDVAGDYLFVHDGTLALSAPLELEANQHLIGEGEGLSIPVSLNGNGSPTLLVAAGTHPQLTNAAGDAVTATEAVPVEIRGLSLQGTGNAIDLTTDAALSGSSTLTIDNNVIRGAGAEGIDVTLTTGTAGTLTLAITGNSWDLAGTHTGHGIDVSRTAGNLRLNVGGNTNVLSTGGQAIAVAGGAVANTLVTGFAGNTIHGNTAGTGVSFSNVTFDADPVTGGFQQVDGDNLPVGASGNPVGGSGFIIGTSQGNLFFDDLDVYAALGTALSLTGTGGGLTFAVTPASPDGSGTSVLDADNGPAVSVTSATVDLRLSDLESNTGTAGVSLSGFGGQLRAPAGSSISRTSVGGGAVFSVANSVSGSSVAYAGTLSSTLGEGVTLTNNTGSTIAFSGGITLSTGGNNGFTATGGGTVTVTDPVAGANTITTAGGTALNVTNTTIGAAGLEFESISAGTSGSPPNGIVLSNTGSAAGLVVTGTGGAGSGGTIRNTTGHGISATNTRFLDLSSMVIGNSAAVAGQAPNATNSIGGAGLMLNNADDVELTGLEVTQTASHCIDGTGVTNLAISNSELLNCGDGNDEHAFAFNDVGAGVINLEGTVTISNTTFDGFAEDGVNVENFAGTMSLTITGSSFANNTSTLCGSSCGENGVLVRADGTATSNLRIAGGTLLNGIDGNGIAVFTDAVGSTADVEVHNTTVAGSRAFGIVLFSGEGTFSFDVGGEAAVSVTGTNSTGISIQPNGDSTMTGRVVNSTVDGSTLGRGIEVLSDDTSAAVVTIQNNDVSNVLCNGIFASNTNTGVLDIHIRNNTATSGACGGLASHAIEVNVQQTSTNCLDIFDNDATPSAGNVGFRTRQRDTSVFRLERFAGNGASTADVVSFLLAQNDPVAPADGETASATVATSYTGVADGFCADPPADP